MDLNSLLEKIEAKLVENDKLLESINGRSSEMKRLCKDEELKITTEVDLVQERVRIVGEVLKNKTGVVFHDLEKVLLDRREVVRTGSLVLCPEIEKIMETGDDEDAVSTLETCWQNIREVMEQELPSIDLKVPLFHPSSTLSTVKASDIGYLCMAEFLPHQFELLLTSPIHLSSDSNSIKVSCLIKTDQMFTDNIQSYVKFSIKNISRKESVSCIMDDCKLSEDKKFFYISFLANQTGMHVLTVLLYGHNITNSPLNIPVTLLETGTPAAPNSEMTSKLETKSSSSGDYNHNASQPQNSQSTSRQLCSPLKSVSPHLNGASSTSISSSAPSIFTSKPSASAPLDLQMYCFKGRLICQKLLSLETGTKAENICKPIGMCLLQNRNIVVSSTYDDKVRMFSPVGQFVSLITVPKSPFTRPTDMVTLHCGQFVVRDDNKVIVFSSEGKFVRTLWQDKGQVKCFGLAQDKEDRVITIMETRSPKRTDLLFFNLKSGELVRKIEMEDIITDKAKSKCRFLTYQLGKLYITDLGLDCVYILDPATISVKIFGESGSGDGQFSDPAGLVVDSVGNIMVADSRNHRLCLFTKEGKFLCKVGLRPEARRPSGLVLDSKNRELYLLNLHGKDAMTKYIIKGM